MRSTRDKKVPLGYDVQPLAFDSALAGPRRLGAERTNWDGDDETRQAREEVESAFRDLNMSPPREGSIRNLYEAALDALHADRRGVYDVESLRRLFREAVRQRREPELKEPPSRVAAMDATIRRMEEKFPAAMRPLTRYDSKPREPRSGIAMDSATWIRSMEEQFPGAMRPIGRY